MTDVQKILAEFTNIEGVHTACLVGRDGFLLDSLARKGIDAEMIGAIASSGFGSAESMGNQLGQGDLALTMIEYVNGPVMFAPVGTEAFLVIVADVHAPRRDPLWFCVSCSLYHRDLLSIARRQRPLVLLLTVSTLPFSPLTIENITSKEPFTGFI